MKTVQYSSQRRGTPNLHLLSHPLTLRRCNLSNESNCIVCRDAPLEFLNLPWCPSPVTGIAVVPSLTQTFPRQELQCPMTNEIRPLCIHSTIGGWLKAPFHVRRFSSGPRAGPRRVKYNQYLTNVPFPCVQVPARGPGYRNSEPSNVGFLRIPHAGSA